MNKKLLMFCVMISLSLCFVGCKKRELPENVVALMSDTTKDTVKLGVYGDPLDLNPILHSESEHGQLVKHFVHAAPLRQTPDGKFVAGLFKDFSCSLNDSGNLVVEGQWRENLKWHDNSEFNPNSLEYTISMMAEKNNESPYYETAKDVVSIENMADNRCKIVFKEDSVKYLELLSLGLMPDKIIGSKINASETYDLSEYANKPIGLGPYMIAERKKGSHIILKPFEAFYDNKAETRPKNVLVHSVYDIQALIADFRAKKYDWINAPSIIIPQLETIGIEKVAINRYVNNACLVWAFNTTKPELANANVRKALDMLIDRNIVKNQFPMDCMPLFASPLSSKNEESDYEKRKTKASEILKAEGYSKEKPLVISILVNDDNLSRKVIAQEMVKMLAIANVNADVVSVPWGEFVNKKLVFKDYSTVLTSLYLPSKGNWGNLLANDKQGVSLNFVGVDNEIITGILNNLDSAVNNNAEEQLRQQLANFLDNNTPFAFLVRPLDVSLSHSEEKTDTTLNHQLFNDVQQWPMLYGRTEQ
jgi:ABC-type transport system substrate-binding protein